MIGDHSKKVIRVKKEVHFDEEEVKTQQPEVLVKKPIEIPLPSPTLELQIEKKESTISFDDFMPQSDLALDILAILAANLTDFECMTKLSMVSKEFHMAVQLRYKYLCIANGFIKGPALELQK